MKLLQFPPEGSSQTVRMRAIPKRLSTPNGYSQDLGFFASWMEKDTISGEHDPHGHNWGAISGLAISVLVSATFWVGAVLLIQRFLK